MPLVIVVTVCRLAKHRHRSIRKRVGYHFGEWNAGGSGIDRCMGKRQCAERECTDQAKSRLPIQSFAMCV